MQLRMSDVRPKHAPSKGAEIREHLLMNLGRSSASVHLYTFGEVENFFLNNYSDFKIYYLIYFEVPFFPPEFS